MKKRKGNGKKRGESRKKLQKKGVETYLEKKVQTLKAIFQARDGDMTIGQASLNKSGSLARVLALIDGGDDYLL
jgi:hypothetical protein